MMITCVKIRGRNLSFVSLFFLLTFVSFGGMLDTSLASSGECGSTSQQPTSQSVNGDLTNEQIPASKLFCTTLHRTAETEQQKCHLAQISNINRKNVWPFLNKHVNRTAVLLCTGPTLQHYTHPMRDEHGFDIVTVGVNGIIFNNDLLRGRGLDYLFVQDTGRLSKATHVHAFHTNVDAFRTFRCNIQKFYGIFQETHIEPTDVELFEGNATRYEMKIPDCGEILPLVDDVGHYTFGGSCSVAFSALQFILYTGISKISLVGCDVTEGVHAGDGSAVVGKFHHRLLEAWKLVPAFVSQYYPEVSVEVVRPVGLKDVGFKVADV
tara:strand:- start:985 stop:1953 length:969 start_codon:yes stop_codon:yes gene_type:complete